MRFCQLVEHKLINIYGTENASSKIIIMRERERERERKALFMPDIFLP